MNLAYNYNDLKKIFNQFGKVQNLRMFVNKYTGKFEGNVLVSFVEQQNVEESMKDFLKEQQIMAYPFEARMVDEVEAEAIIKRLTDVPDVYAVKRKK